MTIVRDRFTPVAILFLLALLAAPFGARAASAGGPEDAPLLGGFGGAVAVVDGTVLVGEPNNSIRPGMVYLYRKAGGSWTEVGTLTASDAKNADGFGASIAVDGAVMAVGAARQNDGRGAVYVFRKGADGRWTETGRLVAADAAEEDGFGASVAVVGDLVLVGAPAHAERTGAVYVFRNANGTWSQIAKLTGPAEAAYFGASLAAGAGRALVGAPGTDAWTGTVYSYRVENGALIEAGTVAGAAKNDRFGASLALRGAEALIGAPTAGGGAGAVFAYRAAGGAWQPAGELKADSVGTQAVFGGSIAFDGTRAVIGAPMQGGRVGRAYVFRRDGGAWTQSGELGLEDGSRGQMFGGSVGVGGDVVAVGVIGADHGAGSVVITERSGDAWTQVARLASPAERLASITGGKIECKEEGKVGPFACGQVDLVSFLSVEDMGGDRGVRLNDVWGWTDPESGKEYALVGRMDATAFVDISDPANPVYVGQLMRTEGSPAAVWRDIKVYKDHAYVVADASGEHGMQVFDLTELRRYAGEPIDFEPATTYRNIHSAHNIVVNEETGFAYAVGSSSGGETCGGGLHMIDIRDPRNPTFAGCFADPQTGRASTGYSHDAQCIVYRGPDETYKGREICLGSNETALSIADVTDKANPVALARASYPNVGYSHQGWITEDHRYFYMNDELDEIQGSVPRTRTMIWDISDLDDPQLAGEFLGTTEASDHNLYIVGDTMYQSHYQAGLRIVDISDPTKPVEVGFLDTVPFGENKAGFGGSWSNYPFFKSGVIVVTSGNEGLFMVRKKDQKPVS